MRDLVFIAVGVALAAGCTVGGGDSAFWTPSQDLGGGAIAGGGGLAGSAGAPVGGNGNGGAGGANGGEGGSVDLGGAAGSIAAGGGNGGGPNSGACAFHVDFTTLTYHGKYSPKNIGAVWISDAQGHFVKSLDVWASTRIVHLVKWNASSGGNQVDAITAATAPSHGSHSADWNCTDVNENPVSDGPYQLHLEFTEEDSAFLIWPPGPSVVIDFEKGPAPVSLGPSDQSNYQSITLTLQ
jgi:hypothetical protein